MRLKIRFAFSSRLPERWALFIACVAAAAFHSADVATADAADANVLEMTARERTPAGNSFAVVEETLRWDPQHTAIIICDMWNKHWCASATRRVAEMAPRMNDTIAATREKGVFIIHAPSDCMEAYKDTPQRKRAQQAPMAANQPPGIAEGCSRLEGEPALPIDDSDGGCDCQPQCPQGSPWKSQIAALEIAPADAISASGVEVWNMLEERGIKNVIVMGVHTNMCVAGRPFALRQMARAGKNVVLARDLTDSMYNPRKAPFVAHRRGTELVVEHLEKYVCPSILAADITADAPPPHVVFLIGEDEYDTRRTVPQFAKDELEPRGIRSTFVQATDEAPNDFPGMEKLDDADLLVVSIRRRAPKKEQLDGLRKYLDSGRPLVGIRTASHAFALREGEPPAGHALWPEFDPEVLGGSYDGHYGNKPPDAPTTMVSIVEAAREHPALVGIPTGPLEVNSHLYKNTKRADSATPLMTGHVTGRTEVHPVTWTNNSKGARIWYTSLGNPDDFQRPDFRRLLTSGIYWALEREVPTAQATTRASAAPASR